MEDYRTEYGGILNRARIRQTEYGEVKSVRKKITLVYAFSLDDKCKGVTCKIRLPNRNQIVMFYLKFRT